MYICIVLTKKYTYVPDIPNLKYQACHLEMENEKKIYGIFETYLNCYMVKEHPFL